MQAKLSVLRACRRVLRPRGRIAYFNIFIRSGLSPGAYARAKRAGPSRVASRGMSQRELLSRAGFRVEMEVDVTGDFLTTARAWNSGRQRFASELRRTLGDAEFSQRQADSRAMISGIEEGLLQRALLVARTDEG